MPSLLALLLATSRVIRNIVVACRFDQQHTYLCPSTTDQRYNRLNKTALSLPDKRTVRKRNKADIRTVTHDETNCPQQANCPRHRHPDRRPRIPTTVLVFELILLLTVPDQQHSLRTKRQPEQDKTPDDVPDNVCPSTIDQRFAPHLPDQRHSLRTKRQPQQDSLLAS